MWCTSKQAEIGCFKIINWSRLWLQASDVLKAITSIKAEEYINNQLRQLNTIKSELKESKNIVVKVKKELLSENKILQKKMKYVS